MSVVKSTVLQGAAVGAGRHCGSRIATLMMVFKLARQAEKHWRKLNKHELVLKVIEGVKFVDGIMNEAA